MDQINSRRSDSKQEKITHSVCVGGPMTLHTALWIYRFYKLWFGAGLLCCLIPVQQIVKHMSQSAAADHTGQPVGGISIHSAPENKAQIPVFRPDQHNKK